MLIMILIMMIIIIAMVTVTNVHSLPHVKQNPFSPFGARGNKRLGSNGNDSTNDALKSLAQNFEFSRPAPIKKKETRKGMWRAIYRIFCFYFACFMILSTYGAVL